MSGLNLSPAQLRGRATTLTPSFTRQKVFSDAPASGRARTFSSGRRRHFCPAASTTLEISVAAEDGSPPLKETFPVADGRELYTASLKKPLGLVLAEKNKEIFVEEVADGSEGKQANIQVGDVLRGTTARSKNIKQENTTTVEAKNKQSFLGGLILMQTDGEDFDTVMAAIMSSKCSSCDVTLVLERPKQG